ncbi:MAG: U32 family peptidase [Prevotella sp.]|nr:U32 family peptidase [Staphylococcus sp.]MCM1349977.1 U32 family peptidase [Prevotella sp.]
MKSFIFEPVSFRQAKQWTKQKKVEHILIPVLDFSLSYSRGYSLKQVQYLINQKGLMRISLNMMRLFHENDLEQVLSFFHQINIEDIEYIFYTDLGLYQMLVAQGYQDKLVYDAHTYLTNASDVTEYAKLNQNVVVSNQISIEELKTLLDHITKPVMIHGFGQSIIFYSRRKLLTRYFEYRHLKQKIGHRQYTLQEEFRTDQYPIVEKNFGTLIYEKGFYYLFEELDQLPHVSHILIHCGTLNEKHFGMVVDSYLTQQLEMLKGLPFDLSKGIMKEHSVLRKEKEN